MAREWPAAKPAKPAKAASSVAPMDAAAAATKPAARSGPPGLQKVLERVQAMPEADRTRGQTQAMTRIERNLQRYLDNQGIPATETTPETAPTEDTAPVAASSPEPTDPSAEPIEALTDDDPPSANA